MDSRQERLQRVHELLIREYGRREWRPHRDPVGELIHTILSQHTSDVNSHRAFDSLRAALPTWQEVRDAPEGRIAEAIRSAGLANVKAQRIKRILQIISASANMDLSFLSQIGLREAKAWLTSLPGVGPKTAACVLLFSLGQPALPVDTHVHRVSRRLGLIEPKVSAEAAHEILERDLAPTTVYSFHTNMVAHGRHVCRAQSPRCAVCVLQPECDYFND